MDESGGCESGRCESAFSIAMNAERGSAATPPPGTVCWVRASSAILTRLPRRAKRHPPHTDGRLGGEAGYFPGGGILPHPRRAAKLHNLFYQLNQLLRQECMRPRWLRPKSEVGNLPPTLGFSIQLASSESLFRRLQATKSARHLADELHILICPCFGCGGADRFARRAPPVRGWEFYKLIRGEMIHGIRNR